MTRYNVVECRNGKETIVKSGVTRKIAIAYATKQNGYTKYDMDRAVYIPVRIK